MESWISPSTMYVLRTELRSPDLATKGLSQLSHVAGPFVIFKGTVLNSEESIKSSANVHGQNMLLTFISNLNIIWGFSTSTAQSL